MEWLQRLTAVYDIIRPVLDVVILSFLFYKVYDLLVKTQVMQMFQGAGFLALVYGLAVLFKLTTLQWVLNILAPGLFVAVATRFTACAIPGLLGTDMINSNIYGT